MSWSETHFVSEHFYPKYDYSDYDDIEQERNGESPAPSSKGNLGLSHRVHPSLRPSSDADPYSYSFTSPSSPRSPSSDSSLSSFVPKGLSSYTPHYSPVEHSNIQPDSSHMEEEPFQPSEQQVDDYYPDLTSNTAALLW